MAGVGDGDGDLEGIRIDGVGLGGGLVCPGTGGSTGRALAAGAQWSVVVSRE